MRTTKMRNICYIIVKENRMQSERKEIKMTKFFSILFNLIYAVAFGAVAVIIYTQAAESENGVGIFNYIFIAFLAYLSLHSFITIIKKLRALSGASIIGGAFAIKRDIPILAITIGIAASEITDFPLSTNGIIYIALSVIGIIGVICTASVAKKYF